MAAPVDAGRATTNVATAASPWTVNLPGSIASGDLLVMFLQVANGRSVTATGWTQLVEDASDGSADNHIVLYRVADGSEGATVSVALTGGTGKGAVIVWRVTGAKTSGTILTSATVVNQGANIDPASASTDGGTSADVLSIVMGGVDGETQTFSAAPSGYANLQTANSGTGSTPATNCVIGAATKGLTAVTSENPGAFTNSAPTTANGGTAFTVLVHAPAGGGGTTYDKTGSVTTAGISSAPDAFQSSETGSVAGGGRSSAADALTAAETGALTVSGRVSGADAFQANRLGSLTAGARASGADVLQATESGTLAASALASGVSQKVAASFDKTGSIAASGLAAGADAFQATETGALTTAALESAADSFQATETGSAVADTTLAGTSQKIAAGLEKTGSVAASARANGADAFTAAETGSLSPAAAVSGTDRLEASETGNISAGVRLSGPRDRDRVRAGSVTAGALLSGTWQRAATAKTGSLVASGQVRAARQVTFNRSASILTLPISAGESQWISSFRPVTAPFDIPRPRGSVRSSPRMAVFTTSPRSSGVDG